MQPSASEIYYFATTSTVGSPLPSPISFFLPFSFRSPCRAIYFTVSAKKLATRDIAWRILRGAKIPLYCKTPEDFGGNEKPADIHVAVPDSFLTENLGIGKLSRYSQDIVTTSRVYLESPRIFSLGILHALLSFRIIIFCCAWFPEFDKKILDGFCLFRRKYALHRIIETWYECIIMFKIEK